MSAPVTEKLYLSQHVVLRSRLRSSFRCSPFRYRSIRFPQIGEVKAIFHRIFTGEDEGSSPGKMRYATVSNLKQGNGLSASLSMMGSLIRNLHRSLRTPPLVSISG